MPVSLLQYLVKAFSGSSEKQQGGARVTVSAPPVEQKPAKDLLADGSSAPSSRCQSSGLSEPAESHQRGFLQPRIPLAGFLCPFQDLCTAPQKDPGVQIEREFPADYTCCDLVVKIKECEETEDPTTQEPMAPEPAPPGRPETCHLSEECSEYQQMPTSSLTLQEALEVRKPQFISRSQERLKKLEHMVQQRKAQQKESLGQKQSLLPVRANKKQFTVPHPLSGQTIPKSRDLEQRKVYCRAIIYNNLPEVRKKKEEQKKRVILQSNRLRAEVFKKLLQKLKYCSAPCSAS
uniref:Fragile-site associated tumor suppressor n=1 Tax=Sus scrofa TaxID=9823 RepID=A0A8D0UWP0_PIG